MPRARTALRPGFVIVLLALGGALAGAVVAFDLTPALLFSGVRSVLETLRGTPRPDNPPGLKPVRALFFEPRPLAGPVIDHAGPTGRAGPEHILISGGLHRLRSHCPRFGCLAWIIDRSGAVQHVWHIDPDIWNGLAESISDGDPALLKQFTADRVYPFGVHLYANGDLLVSFMGQATHPYGVGLARFDRNSRLLWQRTDFSHHWPVVDGQGAIHTPSLSVIPSPLEFPGAGKTIRCRSGSLHADRIAILDPGGRPVETIPLLQVLVDSGHAGLLRDGCDPLHLNAVQPLSARDAPAYPGLVAGDLLVSLRTLDTVAILSRRSRRITWIMSGQTRFQYSPVFFGNNEILVFDNRGRHSGDPAAVVAVNLATRALRTLFPRPERPLPFSFVSTGSGHIALSGDRTRALLSVATGGQVLEVDLTTGALLWEYRNSHDMTGYFEARGIPVGPEMRHLRFQTSNAQYVTHPFRSGGGAGWDRRDQ